MTLEAVISDKAQIPEGLEAHYKEVDGKFVLQANGMKTQQDFDNYADALKKRFADAGADFARSKGAGLTRDDVVDVVNKALEKFAPPGGSLPNGKGNGKDGDDQIPESVSARLHDLERNVASLTEDNAKLKDERDAALGRSRDTTIRNALTEAATKSGAQADGIANLVTLVAPNFEVSQDGSVVTKLDAGVSPNVKPEDYFSNLARDAQYRMFWPASKGGGADNGGGAGGGGNAGLGKDNPWSKAGWNMTEQSKLYAADPARAKEMMAAAGVELGAVAPVR